jgi:hypothetical protein
VRKQEDELLHNVELLTAILAKYGNGAQARFVEHLANLKRRNSRDFEMRLAGVEMWGGSGAVWEVPRFREEWMNPEVGEDVDADQLRFADFSKHLADYMNENRIGSDEVRERAQYLGDTLLNWASEDR